MAAVADRPDHRSVQRGMGGPGLQQGAIDREVLVAEERLELGCRHQLLQEAAHDLLVEKSFPVFGECGGVPDRIIRAEPHKPAKQQVVVELLQQKALGADPVERLQKRDQQQLLRRHRWPAFCRVQRAEGGIESIKGLIRQFSDPPQRMAGRDPLLDRYVGEQGAAALPVTSHLGWAIGPFSRRPGFSANSSSSTAGCQAQPPPSDNRTGIHAPSRICWDGIGLRDLVWSSSVAAEAHSGSGRRRHR